MRFSAVSSSALALQEALADTKKRAQVVEYYSSVMAASSEVVRMNDDGAVDSDLSWRGDESMTAASGAQKVGSLGLLRSNQTSPVHKAHKVYANLCAPIRIIENGCSFGLIQMPSSDWLQCFKGPLKRLW